MIILIINYDELLLGLLIVGVVGGASLLGVGNRPEDG